MNNYKTESWEKEINKFITKWCGSSAGHLLDSDDNDGQYLKDFIEKTIREVGEETFYQGEILALNTLKRNILMHKTTQNREMNMYEIINSIDISLNIILKTKNIEKSIDIDEKRIKELESLFVFGEKENYIKRVKEIFNEIRKEKENEILNKTTNTINYNDNVFPNIIKKGNDWTF